MAGSGPPLVLVHGLGVSADYWVRNGPRLATEGFQVLALDLPGFGRSGGLGGGLGVRAQADAVRAWALALDLPPAVYFGHSLSCQTVLELVANHPESARGIVLAAPTGDGPPLRRLLRQAIGLLLDLPRESVELAMLVASAYLHAGPVHILKTWVLGARHDPLPLLPRIPVPGLIVAGGRDPAVREEFARRLAGELPKGRLVVIPEAAHGVIFEPSDAFNLVTLEFLHRLETREVRDRADRGRG